ncbi:MAG: toll/interleukin-1 receptor domain-containing protein [Promethearchaeota archaeon]|jgi:hypothetical protein
MSHIVFISYAKENEDIAGSICKALENEDIKCWIAPRDILPGISYPKAIITAIKSSNKIVLVLSKYSNRSKHVLRELERALINDIQIVPIKIEDVVLSEEMEYFIGTTQWLDATSSPIDSYLPQIIQSITSIPMASTSSSEPSLSGLHKTKEFKLDDVKSITESEKLPSRFRLKREVLGELKSAFSEKKSLRKRNVYLSYAIDDKKTLKIEKVGKKLSKIHEVSYSWTDLSMQADKELSKNLEMNDNLEFNEKLDMEDNLEMQHNLEMLEELRVLEEESYDKFITHINEDVENCDVMTLFCTVNSFKSGIVKREWKIANELGKPIIPFFFKKEDIPLTIQKSYLKFNVEFDIFNIDRTVSDINSKILELFKSEL